MVTVNGSSNVTISDGACSGSNTGFSFENRLEYLFMFFSPYGIFTKGYYNERDMFVCIQECSVAGIEI